MKYFLFLLLSSPLAATVGPDFFVIGTQKGGTTSLHAYLNEHPQIHLPKSKELHFFDLYFSRGVEYYLKRFLPKKNGLPITGDITPRYLPHPQAAERAFTYFPDAKIILLLRNPVDRAFSRYKFDIAFKNTTKTFEEYIAYEMKEMKLNRSNFDFCLERGFYAKQLKNWLQYYPKEQFLILISEDFFKNTQACMDRIYEFLGVLPHKHTHFPVALKGDPDLKLTPEMRKLLEEFYAPYNSDLQQLFDELELNIKLNW